MKYAGGDFLYDAASLLLSQTMEALPPPTPADLAETPEVRLSPELLSLAASLGNDPLRLYNHVHDDYAAQVYYGARKGSDGARETRSGNDFDLSALLVALLRASGVPARFEYGSVTLSPAQAMSWAGTQTVGAAASFFASAGYPGRVRYGADGNVSALQLEHVWVRAHVPYDSYRGLPPSTGERTWIRLDPTLKRSTFTAPVDLRGAVPFGFADYVTAQHAELPLARHEAALRAHVLASGLACTNLDQATVRPSIIPEGVELLPAELPARVDASLLVFSEVPAALRAQVRYQVGGATLTLPLAELYGKRLALRYRGATPADDAAIAAAGGLLQVAPFRVNVIPTLRVDGIERAVGQPVRPGTTQTLVAQFTGPRASYAPTEHFVVAGEAMPLQVDAAGTSAAEVTRREVELTAARAVGGDELTEATGRLALARYFHDTRRDVTRLYALHRFGTYLDLNEGAATRRLQASLLFGQPVSLTERHWTIDITRGGSTPFSQDDDRAAALRAQVGLYAGYQTSAAEHRVWEETVFGRAISAVRTLGAASEQGVALLTLTAADAAQVAGLPYSDVSRRDLASLLQQGYRVTLPARPVTVGPFADVEGYIGEELSTGAGVYRLFGTTNGGAGEGGSSGGTGGGGCSCPSCCGSAGSQVDYAFGSYEHTDTDLSLPAVGRPVVHSRTYRSKTLSPREGILGAQWWTAWDARVVVEAGGVTYVDEGLREWRFATVGGGVYTRPAGYHAALTEEPGGGYRLTQKDGSFAVFAASGLVSAWEDLHGNRLTVVRDAQGRPTEVRDATNRAALTFVYGAGGLLSSVTDAAGRTVSYEHTGRDLTAVVDVSGARWGFSYDGSHRLTEKTDPLGNVTSYRHDAEGRLASVVDALGHETRIAYDFVNKRAVHYDKTGAPRVWEYDGRGSPTAKTDALGNRVSYTWDADKNRTSETDARGNTSTSAFDTDGNVLTRTDALGVASTYTYDGAGRVLAATDALGHVTTNAYSPAGDLLSTTDAAGTVTTYGYSARGELQRLTQPGGGETTFAYNPDGSIASLTDAEGGVTLLGYDAAGQLTSLTDPLGNSRLLTLDAGGRITAMTDAEGNVTTFEYDLAGRRTATVDASGARTTVSYDAMGRPLTTTDAAGHVRSTEYDAEGRVVASVDARGSRSVLRYDAAGRVIESVGPDGAVSSTVYCADASPCAAVDPLGHVTRTELDDLGRATSVTDPLGRVTSQAYDVLGRRTSQTDSASNVTGFGFDALGRLASVTDALGGVTAYEYDARGNRTAVVDANGGRTEFAYDLGNRLVSETNPIGVVTSFTFDAAGNRESKLDGNGLLTRYTYDGNRRLLRALFGDGTAYDFAFNDQGQRTLERSASHERTMTFDQLGQPLTVADATIGRTITYEHDAEGNRTAMTLDSGERTTWRYDAAGRVVEHVDPDGDAYRYFYDLAGRRTRLTFPNGVVALYGYDDASQVTSIVYRGPLGDVQTSFTYVYDAAGNRLEKRFADGTAEVYGYDALNRLTAVTYPSGRVVHYELDALGNRLSLTETLPGQAATTDTYSYNLFNQLLSVTGPSGVTTFTYDGNGNQTRKAGPDGTTDFVWDPDNRLRAIAEPSRTHTFAYDANGLRVWADDDYGARYQLLDGITVIAEYAAPEGPRTAWFTQSVARIDELLAVTNTHAKHCAQLDALGSVYAEVDLGGVVRGRSRYDVFGAIERQGSSIEWAWAWQGRELIDGRSSYHRDRQFGHVVGGWLSVDRLPSAIYRVGGRRLESPGSISEESNWYLALGQNPTRHVDPTGRQALAVGVVAVVLLTILIAVVLYRTKSTGLVLPAAKLRHFRQLPLPRDPAFSPGACRDSVADWLSLAGLNEMQRKLSEAQLYVVDLPGDYSLPGGMEFKAQTDGRDIYLNYRLFEGLDENDARVALIAEAQHLAAPGKGEAKLQEELEEMLGSPAIPVGQV